MACVYFTASSLDGYIVDEHASLEWLVHRDIDPDGPFSVESFLPTVGSLVMGADTYEWIATNQPGAWPYEQPSWVLTHRPDIVVAGHPVTVWSGDITDLMPALVEAAGERDVWVVGGGQVAAQFAAAGLIDELVVAYAPCTLGAGAPVLPLRTEWTLVSSAVNGEFVCARWRRT
jgi:dihydrofolate reductase